jgi:hypothetical protein
MDNYAITPERMRAVLEGKIRLYNEQIYSLEVDARVNTRLGEKDMITGIKADIAKVMKAIDLVQEELARLADDNAGRANGHRLEALETT